jgi:ketosteroid isomerase-like protein
MNTKAFYEDLAKKIFAAMNSGDFDQVSKDMSDDIVFDFPGIAPLEGQRRVIVFLKTLLRKYKNLVFKISDILTDNERACVVWTNFGEFKGEEYANSGMTLIHFDGDKISFLSDYFKDTSFTEN